MFWLRSAEAEDFETVCDLLILVGLPQDDLTPEHLQHFVVADHDGLIRGVVGLEPLGDDALVRSLAVASDYRGQGVAGRLLDEIEAVAKKKGLKRLFGLTTTAEAYLMLRGFLRIDRSSVPSMVAASAQFALLCPSEAVCLEKRLD